MNIPKVNDTLILKDECPVIAVGTSVKVLAVYEFDKTNSVFITIQDLENHNLNHKQQKEPIISTIRYHMESI